MSFTPRFLTSQIGSIPHPDGAAVSDRLAQIIDIPAWPQLPRRSFRESMYVQYSFSLPAVVIDETREKIFFDTSEDISPAVEAFYNRYLADDLESFGLPPDYAAGFYSMLDALKRSSGEWAKGQVTGPVSFGLTVTDQDLRASLYNDMLADVIVKNLAMNARWQARQLKAVRPNVIIFVDEPYLASFGSAFVSLSRDQVVACLDEVHDFIERGGIVAWGIVPTGDEIFGLDAPGLAKRLLDGLKMISEKAQSRGTPISLEALASHSLVTPACGLGSSSMATAEKVIETLVKTSEILKK